MSDTPDRPLPAPAEGPETEQCPAADSDYVCVQPRGHLTGHLWRYVGKEDPRPISDYCGILSNQPPEGATRAGVETEHPFNHASWCDYSPPDESTCDCGILRTRDELLRLRATLSQSASRVEELDAAHAYLDRVPCGVPRIVEGDSSLAARIHYLAEQWGTADARASRVETAEREREEITEEMVQAAWTEYYRRGPDVPEHEVTTARLRRTLRAALSCRVVA
jgi:hypothetical protein